MTDCLCVKGFNEITYDELMDVVGGFSWSDLGCSVFAGVIGGSLTGACAGGVGAIPGGFAGGLIGGITYCGSEVWKSCFGGGSN